MSSAECFDDYVEEPVEHISDEGDETDNRDNAQQFTASKAGLVVCHLYELLLTFTSSLLAEFTER